MAMSTRHRFMWLCLIGGIATAVSMRGCSSNSNVVEFPAVTEESLTPEQLEALRKDREMYPNPAAMNQYILDAEQAEQQPQEGAGN